MAGRLSDLLNSSTITNNLTTSTRTTGLVLDARQGQVLDAKIAGLDATKSIINFIIDPFAQFTAYQGQYYAYGDILYKRTGGSITGTANGNLYEGSPGWTYVLGATFFDGFINYGDHSISNDSRWVKYQKGVVGQRAIRGQIWYYAGLAYRNIDTNSTNGIGIGIGSENDFQSTSKWEPIIYPASTFVPDSVKNLVKNTPSSSWTSGELQGTQPIGSVSGMKFCDANYRYEYMNGMADTTGTTYVWVRLLKSI